MKRVLITGANSYLGDSAKRYILEKDSVNYEINILDMQKEWKNYDFKNIDVIFNVAAIVHKPKEKEDIYFRINRDMAIELANIAKQAGVKHFIQMSTMNVFGKDKGVITEESDLNPKSYYGRSKLEADKLLLGLSNNSFKVCVVRPPMIYGNGCKGNYNALEKFALKSPVFPSYKNKRDFIYIGNMCDAIFYYIRNEIEGICYPRDPEPSSTKDIVKYIADLNGKKIRLLSLFNPFISIFMKFNHKFVQVFGDLSCSICDKSGWVAPKTAKEGLVEMYEHFSN